MKRQADRDVWRMRMTGPTGDDHARAAFLVAALVVCAFLTGWNRLPFTPGIMLAGMQIFSSLIGVGAVFLVFTASLGGTVIAGASWYAAGPVTLVDCVCALLVAVYLSFRSDNMLKHPVGFIQFFVVSIGSAALSAWISGLIPSSPAAPDLQSSFAGLWMSRSVGLIIGAPVFLLPAHPAGTLRSGPTESIIAVAGTVVIAFLLFGLLPDPTDIILLPYILLPFLLWVAIRSGARVFSLLLPVVATLCFKGTAAGLGTFGRGTEPHGLPIAGLFLLVAAGTGFVVATLVTGRERSSRLLRLQSHALDATVNAVVITDREGRIVHANSAFSLLTGYARDEAIGLTPRILRSGRQPDAFYAGMWQTILAGNVWQGVLVNARKDGTLYDEEMTITPLRDEAGTITHFVAIKLDVTRRRQEENTVRAVKERLEAIVRSSSAAIFDLDASGRVDTLWNPASERMFGFSRKEAIGHVPPFVPDQGIPEFQDLFARALRGEMPESVERRRRRRDGSPIDVSISTAPLRDAEGSVGGVMSVIVDITAKKQAEEALRANEALVQRQLAELRQVFRYSPVGLFVIDRDLRIVHINEHMADIGNKQVDECIGREIGTVFHVGHGDLDALCQSVLSSGAPVLQREISEASVAGAERIWVASYYPWRLHTGEVAGIFGSVVDVTDLKRHERTRRRLEEQHLQVARNLQLHIDRMPIGYIVTDRDFSIIEFNPAAELIFGYTFDELRGRRPYGTIIPESALAFTEELREQWIRGRATVHGRHQNQTKDGRTIVCEWFNTPILDDHGNFDSLMSMVLDITDRVAADRAMEEARIRTENLSRRLLDVQESERRHIARELHDEIGQVLTAIKINLRTAPGGGASDLAERLDDSVGLVDRAIDQVRAISLDLRPSVLDDLGLAAALRWHIDRIRQRAPGTIHVRLPDHLPRLGPGIETAAFRIVQEALTNALRHARANTIDVDVVADAENAHHPHRRRRGWVRDRQGGRSGRPQWPYRPSGNDGTRSPGRRRGNHLFLPRKRHGGFRQLATHPCGADTVSPVRVILADDHALVRAGIRALIQQVEGYEVIGEAGNGQDALDLCRRHNPDLALLDIGMSGLNGLEVTARVVRTCPETRVIMLSMHDAEEYVLQALRNGASGYLLKDAATSELEIAMRAVTGGETYLSPRVSQHIVRDYRERSEQPGPLASLTSRQREVLQLLAEGKTAKEIAVQLGLSTKTVESHRSQLMERLGIHDLPGLVKLAIRAGIISPP